MSIDHGTIYHCVGTEAEFAALVRLAGDGLFPLLPDRFRYAGCRCPSPLLPDTPVLLMNTGLSNIAECIRCEVDDISFVFRGRLLSAGDDGLLRDTEHELLSSADYPALKELNIIRMVFCIIRRLDVMTSYPVHIQLEHTTFCNARCIMCDHFVAHNRGSRHLQLRALDLLDKQLTYADEIIMHGNGEPLLHPDILEFFERYGSRAVKVSLNTNLSHLDSDIIDAIRTNCRSIHVSCDGASKAEYEQIRRGLSFETFISNMEALGKAANRVEKVLEVVLMRQNVRSAPLFIELARQYGFSRVMLNPLGVNVVIGNEADGLDCCQDIARRFCSAAKELGERCGITVVTPFDGRPDAAVSTAEAASAEAVYPDAELSDKLHREHPFYTNRIAFTAVDDGSLLCRKGAAGITGVCEYPFAKTYIDLNGNVSFCCPASRRIVGAVTESSSFDSVWNGERYRTIRRTLYERKLPMLCESCYFIGNGSLCFMEQRNGGWL